MHSYESLSLAWNSSFWDRVDVKVDAVHVIENFDIDVEIMDEATFDSPFLILTVAFEFLESECLFKDPVGPWKIWTFNSRQYLYQQESRVFFGHGSYSRDLGDC